MWISKKHYEELKNEAWAERVNARNVQSDFAALHAQLTNARTRVTQLQSEMNWFKHRLTQVERERGQLIQAAIGVKVAVPEFVQTYEDPGEALNELPNLSTVGGDAAEEPMAPGEMNPGIDYTMMPGYKR